MKQEMHIKRIIIVKKNDFNHYKVEDNYPCRIVVAVFINYMV